MLNKLLYRLYDSKENASLLGTISPLLVCHYVKITNIIYITRKYLPNSLKIKVLGIPLKTH